VSQNVILASNTFLTHEIKFVTTLKNETKLMITTKYESLHVNSEHKNYNV